MQRAPILICLILGVLCAAPVAAQDSFEAERQAALQQVARIEQAYAERLGSHGADWRGRVTTEERALLAALDWFTRNAEGDQALRLAVPLAYFWMYDGRAVEARDL